VNFGKAALLVAPLKPLSGIVTGIGAAFSGFPLASILAVGAAVTAVAGSFLFLTKTGRSFLIPVTAAISDFADFVSDRFSRIGSNFSEVYESIVKLIKDGRIEEAWALVANASSKAFGEFFGGATEEVTRIRGEINRVAKEQIALREKLIALANQEKDINKSLFESRAQDKKKVETENITEDPRVKQASQAEKQIALLETKAEDERTRRAESQKLRIQSEINKLQLEFDKLRPRSIGEQIAEDPFTLLNPFAGSAGPNLLSDEARQKAMDSIIRDVEGLQNSLKNLDTEADKQTLARIEEAKKNLQKLRKDIDIDQKAAEAEIQRAEAERRKAIAGDIPKSVAEGFVKQIGDLASDLSLQAVDATFQGNAGLAQATSNTTAELLAMAGTAQQLFDEGNFIGVLDILRTANSIANDFGEGQTKFTGFAKTINEAVLKDLESLVSDVTAQALGASINPIDPAQADQALKITEELVALLKAAREAFLKGDLDAFRKAQENLRARAAQGQAAAQRAQLSQRPNAGFNAIRSALVDNSLEASSQLFKFLKDRDVDTPEERKRLFELRRNEEEAEARLANFDRFRGQVPQFALDSIRNVFGPLSAQFLDAQQVEKERQAALKRGDVDAARALEGQLIGGFQEAFDTLQSSIKTVAATGGFGLDAAFGAVRGTSRVQDVIVKNLDPLVNLLLQQVQLLQQRPGFR
jgi:hypothetical protein